MGAKTDKKGIAQPRKKQASHHKAQLFASMLVLLVGCGMVILGILIPPVGEIHPTVLIAFGECLTFAGAVLGAKYYADFKTYVHSLTHHKTEKH